MVRMMAGVGTAKYSKKLYSQEVFDYIRSNRTLMLALAKRNLLHLTYFGVLVITSPSPPPGPNARFSEDLKSSLSNRNILMIL